MNSMDEYLEHVWNGILSQEEEIIRQTFAELDENSKQVVINHLLRMVSEDGWLAVQVASARAALKALEDDPYFTDSSS